MSKVIKNGTIVTADRTYKGDVKIDGVVFIGFGTKLATLRP